MPKGLPRSIIEKYGITKKAWEVYRSLMGKRKTYKGSNPLPIIGVRRMPKKKRWSRRRDKRLPILPLVGFAYNFVRPLPSGRTIMADFRNGNIDAAIYDMKECFTGIMANGVFSWQTVAQTYIPILIGALASKLATATGVNRSLKRVPLIGRYIKL